MCHFKLVAVVGYLIRLSIESVQIEADNCVTDSLTIYDSLMPLRSTILYRYSGRRGKKLFYRVYLWQYRVSLRNKGKKLLHAHMRSKTDPRLT